MPIRRLALPLALLTAACVDLDFSELTSAFGGGPLEISVSGGGAVEIGDTLRMSATGRPSGIAGILLYDRLLDAHWTVSSPVVSLRKLDPPPGDSTTPTQALVTGLRAGDAIVSVTARGASGQASVRVIPILAALVVRPSRDTIAVGDTVEVRVGAVDSTGATVTDVPIAASVSGGARLIRNTNAALTMIGTSPGSAVIVVRFRRHASERTLTVVP